ncbi:hypothetical protein GUA87_01260 [Sneathiella sp. P13V-1]|uniref:acyl-CoA dehydrogenase family protein n=1 Tax=Sneathiella sp. P13V-1 TaxID=2697366 RepID=UPI00187B2CAE|nr:acyl-CoA dehydrogenase family protein [Sneathiella sp. P13V-1]MBE7635457.1 hypothetical protein [Sneathiella sp. P13V-1]
MQFQTPGLQDIVDDFVSSFLKDKRHEWESTKTQHMELFQEASKFGLLGLETDPAHGGLGAPFSDKVKLAELMAQTSFAAAFSIINSQNVAARLRESTAQRHHQMADEIMAGDRVGCTALTEPTAGSDFAAIQTSAKKIDGVWEISGNKAWITNATNAETIILYAQTDPTKGWKGIASFLIDGRKAGFERGESYSLIGGHIIGAGEFSLSSYVASEEDMLAPPGEAFKVAMTSINGARTYVAAMCVGMMKNALELATAYGKERNAFGKPLLTHQGMGWSLSDIYTNIAALEGLVEKSAALIDGKQDAVLAAALAKKMAGDITIPAISACIQAMGANGLRSEHFLGEHLACAKIAAYTDGSTEMMKERISAYL